MQENQISKYPNTFFRVSLKAVIRNKKGELLCVKEAGSDWTLPGGGLDHGESIEQGLRRELLEEVALSQNVPLSFQPIGHDVMWVESRQAWQLWVIFRVTFDAMPQFSKGVDADDIAFIDPKRFKDSPHRAQQLIYKWLVASTEK